jgi:hypothetical protein
MLTSQSLRRKSPSDPLVNLAGCDSRRILALILPAVPCRKAVTVVDDFGTCNVVSDIVVEEFWKREDTVRLRKTWSSLQE